MSKNPVGERYAEVRVNDRIGNSAAQESGAWPTLASSGCAKLASDESKGMSRTIFLCVATVLLMLMLPSGVFAQTQVADSLLTGVGTKLRTRVSTLCKNFTVEQLRAPTMARFRGTAWATRLPTDEIQVTGQVQVMNGYGGYDVKEYACDLAESGAKGWQVVAFILREPGSLTPPNAGLGRGQFGNIIDAARKGDTIPEKMPQYQPAHRDTQPQ